MVRLEPEVPHQVMDDTNDIENMSSTAHVDHDKDPLVTGSAIGLISSIDDKTNTSVFSSAVSTAADLNGVPTILSNIDTDTLKLKTDAKVAFFDEDFEKAVWIFTHALANGPATAELYACRAKLKKISGKLVLALEGGYGLDAIADSCAECVNEMLSRDGTDEVKHKYEDADESTLKAIAEVKSILGEFWTIFHEEAKPPEDRNAADEQIPPDLT